MSRLRAYPRIVARSVVLLGFTGGLSALGAQQQVQVIVTAVPNPLPAGTCTGIWVEVRDEFNQRINKLASGLALHSRSYDYSQPNAVDFSWKNNDQSTGYLCARVTAGAANTVVTATIRGTPHSGTTAVTIQPAAPAAGAVASAAPSAAPAANPPVTQPYPAPGPPPTPTASPPGGAPIGQGQPPSAGAPPSGSSQPTTTSPPSGYGQPPSAAAAPPTYAQPPASGNPAAQPYVPPSPSSGAGAPQPTSGQPPAPTAADPAQPHPSSGYPAPSSGTAPPPPFPTTPAAGAPSATATAPTGTPAAGAPAQADTGLKSGGLLKRIGGHAKRKAGQVKAETADNLAAATNEVIDTTLESGSGVVTSTAAEASSAARIRIGGAGQSLTPSGQRGAESSDNLATALASGRAVLRSIRFTGATSVLEPSARELVKRLAAALERTPGSFLIEAHVDALQSPAAAQELSERRAAAVKAALIKQGIPAARLTALGYGATRPMPEVPVGGGPPSSARIEVARTQ